MRRVPTEYVEGQDCRNAQKAWLEGYDAGQRDLVGEADASGAKTNLGAGADAAPATPDGVSEAPRREEMKETKIESRHDS